MNIIDYILCIIWLAGFVLAVRHQVLQWNAEVRRHLNCLDDTNKLKRARRI